MSSQSATLVVLRHGQSVWNRANRFTGWSDVGLSAQGVTDAQRVGEQLRAAGLHFDLAVTSALSRATDTLTHALHTFDRPVSKTIRSWRLNDRHYGALTGMEKDEAALAYGAQCVRQWRRGFDLAPPPLDAVAHAKLVGALCDDAMPAPAALPRTESLRDTLHRVLPLWDDCVAPALVRGQSVLMVGHGNSLRALFKQLDQIGDDAIAQVEVAHAEPLVMRFDAALEICSRMPLGALLPTR
ncbi:2,3-bisphosphoglycerate-dependent phosphoglycerate mutase [Paraburkholderia sp. Ac-20336]|uniref:2,3-bisphosphoglycerate-dependent phosphoglycerate mutase n=1 Tax=Burkholderiaceae TaxID=119060 RepID=UPI00141F959D|nr:MULTISPECIES: 2,3-bisphosphoglycerate-dependent phosphoglycerate mutase [Burkholderiaceae]MBN3801480.1 2,3-bisphosphoglycerate-dependent phosphoglycerate mutase [Paraburkholderia sp. Ac-20336]MBN3846031.1 2,3-bisphosphoglycerate-dependent phosphoglycerate mutase [Paraburkholderia sp. Ac-20342]NIF54173.1 2,3-bisphosphoglycerate-dependent phosphoglycerate mutase [Burkholderia sp. Ax-1724]NIF77717.1 2,3-bisphosphoglycerate-dependent phosphoglycerate mutase [Paraburkholderia sp. Cy-641]